MHSIVRGYIMGALLGAVMRLCSVLLCLAAACFASQSLLSQSCEPTASARAVLEQLQVPDDAHLPPAQAPRTQVAIAAQGANSLPGSSSRFTTKSCNTFSQATSSRDPARRESQNSCSPSCRYNSHPNQQLPKTRGRRSSRPLTFTCKLSTASAGISRSSGNKLKFAYSCCSSSNTESVLRHAACCWSLISPR